MTTNKFWRLNLENGCPTIAGPIAGLLFSLGRHPKPYTLRQDAPSLNQQSALLDRYKIRPPAQDRAYCPGKRPLTKSFTTSFLEASDRRIYFVLCQISSAVQTKLAVPKLKFLSFSVGSTFLILKSLSVVVTPGSFASYSESVIPEKTDPGHVQFHFSRRRPNLAAPIRLNFTPSITCNC